MRKFVCYIWICKCLLYKIALIRHGSHKSLKSSELPFWTMKKKRDSEQERVDKKKKKRFIIYLAGSGLSCSSQAQLLCGMWDLHSPSRGQTRVPCIESTEPPEESQKGPAVQAWVVQTLNIPGKGLSSGLALGCSW